ncbi:hypothetical protein RUND412_007567 [Rhizina undulata]
MADHSLILYARHHGISRNYMARYPLSQPRPTPLPPITDIREPFTFTPQTSLPSPPPPPPEIIERLVMDNETAAFLTSLSRLRAESLVEAERALSAEDFRWSRGLRVEEALVSDLGGVEFRRRTVEWGKEGLGLEMAVVDVDVDADGDGGMGWSEKVRREVEGVVGRGGVEKMVMDAETMAFLREVNRFSGMKEDGEEPQYPEPITPHLLPHSSVAPSLPSLPLSSLDLIPLDAGTTSDLLSDLIHPFTLADTILKASSPTSSPSHFLQTLPSTPSPLRKRPLPQDLTIETPLHPAVSAPKKVKSKPFPAATSLEPIRKPGDEADSEEDQEVILEEIRAAAGTLEREIAQEQLQEADSTLRIDVPVMDFSMTKAPWDVAVGESLGRFRNLVQWAGLAGRKWDGVRSIEIDLPWKPFVKGMEKIPRECLEDAGVLEELVITPEQAGVGERELMEWLRGYKIPEEEVFGEVLGHGLYNEKTDLENLIKKKKKKRKRKNSGMDIQPPSDMGIQPAKALESLEKSIRNRLPDPKPDNSFAGKSNTFSAVNSLNDFMALRSRVHKLKLKQDPRKPVLPDIINTTNPVPPGPTITNPLTTTTAQSPAAENPPILPIPPPQKKIPPEFPTPKFHLPAIPAPYIVSTTLLSERLLLRLIRELYPNAKFVERDFSTPHPSVKASLFSPERGKCKETPEETSEEAENEEADLLLSPKTGVIITTLHQIRQKSLPGQTQNNASRTSTKIKIRDRIKAVSRKHERLHVLIHNTTPFASSKSDNEALSSFAGFAHGLRSNIIVKTIVGDREKLARWVVALMLREGVEDAKLLEEETTWEVFLRIAGFNAFAAQAVLRGCSREGEGRRGGLCAFLRMGEEERRGRFEGLVGRRVLGRVQGRLGGVWGDEEGG